MELLVTAVRDKVVGTDVFKAIAKKFETALRGSKPKTHPERFVSTAVAVIDEGGSLHSLCLMLDVEVQLWTSAPVAETEELLRKLAAAVAAFKAPAEARSELRLLLRPVRELAGASGIEAAAAALDAASAKLPVHAAEAFYDEEEAEADDEGACGGWGGVAIPRPVWQRSRMSRAVQH